MKRLFGGGDRGIGETVYGTVVVLAILADGAVQDVHPTTLVLVVAAGSGTIWIAHLYAYGLGESIEHGHRLSGGEAVGIVRRQLPILLAAVPPTVALLLGAADVLAESTAIWLAFALGLGTLALQGLRYARIERFGLLASVGVLAANLVLGGIVVALKVLVAH